jgi:hypothetical protein
MISFKGFQIQSRTPDFYTCFFSSTIIVLFLLFSIQSALLSLVAEGFIKKKRVKEIRF